MCLYLSAILSFLPSVRVSFIVCLSVCLYMCLSVSACFCVFLSSLSFGILFQSVFLCVCISLSLSLYGLYLSVLSHYICFISLSLCLCLSLSLSLSLSSASHSFSYKTYILCLSHKHKNFFSFFPSLYKNIIYFSRTCFSFLTLPFSHFLPSSQSDKKAFFFFSIYSLFTMKFTERHPIFIYNQNK